MHIAQDGEGTLVVLCHGYPELWYSWRHQLRALAEAGYHAVAPDQRGYGGPQPELKEAEYENLITNTIRLEPQRLTESSKSESVPSTVEIPGRDVR